MAEVTTQLRKGRPWKQQWYSVMHLRGRGLVRTGRLDKSHLVGIPVDERVVDGHNAEGSQVVPAEAHGDEHEV